jgi:hypothetical protein
MQADFIEYFYFWGKCAKKRNSAVVALPAAGAARVKQKHDKSPLLQNPRRDDTINHNNTEAAKGAVLLWSFFRHRAPGRRR